MSLGNKIAVQLPYLRRYARALTGSQAAGDALVMATLETAIADRELQASLETGRVALYKAFNRVWSEAATAGIPGTSARGPHEEAANERLQRITPANRQALLLTTLEEFNIDEAGEIMGLDAEEISDLAQDAIAEIDRESATSVLIIEDEPLISMQLEELVDSLGHQVCGTAATRTQAQEVIARSLPGLVLADIQLADGSSGLDAVDDILALTNVPVVFVTAYPERLLTGARKEPTYLVTKPFKEATVRAAISQALFFRSSQPVA
jgi:CheY-like chemotaxis protein/DNA-directed RNA polymerase specialized sigma24 family protein